MMEVILKVLVMNGIQVLYMSRNIKMHKIYKNIQKYIKIIISGSEDGSFIFCHWCNKYIKQSNNAYQTDE